MLAATNLQIACSVNRSVFHACFWCSPTTELEQTLRFFAYVFFAGQVYVGAMLALGDPPNSAGRCHIDNGHGRAPLCIVHRLILQSLFRHIRRRRGIQPATFAVRLSLRLRGHSICLLLLFVRGLPQD